MTPEEIMAMQPWEIEEAAGVDRRSGVSIPDGLTKICRWITVELWKGTER